MISAYWNSVSEKRRLRNQKRRDNQDILLDDYVLTQPPVYSGPPEPVNPSIVQPERPPKTYIPVAADLLKAADEHFNFVPERPQTEQQYKQRYAKAASAAGLTRDQAVRIYAFECGGNGTYDVQAGLEYRKPGAKAISTALGYNQLLTTNSIELLAEQGDEIVKTLSARAKELSGEARGVLELKITRLKRMISFTKTVPDDWNEHQKLADTPQGLGIHALNFDIDVGPLLQTQKLLNSIVFARRKGVQRMLTAAELEMMNLTGDGNGFDMVTMPSAIRDKVPTSNFFLRSGYERNSVAIRNNVVAKLIATVDARMNQETQLQGARDLASYF